MYILYICLILQFTPQELSAEPRKSASAEALFLYIYLYSLIYLGEAARGGLSEAELLQHQVG